MGVSLDKGELFLVTNLGDACNQFKAIFQRELLAINLSMYVQLLLEAKEAIERKLTIILNPIMENQTMYTIAMLFA